MSDEYSRYTRLEHGDKAWYNDEGVIHRDGYPAVIKADGTEVWYQHGRIHREDGPAIIEPATYNNAKICWCRHEQLHRDNDEPAVIYFNGTKEWYQNGKRHRVGGPAVTYKNGAEIWYQNGRQHREDGPAQTFPNGHLCWYRNGEKHRADGPAIIFPDGSTFWHYDGFPAFNRKQFQDLSSLSDEDITILILKYGEIK